MMCWMEELFVGVLFGCGEETRFLGLVFWALGLLVLMMVDAFAGRVKTVRTGSGFLGGGGT